MMEGQLVAALLLVAKREIVNIGYEHLAVSPSLIPRPISLVTHLQKER